METVLWPEAPERDLWWQKVLGIETAVGDIDG